MTWFVRTTTRRTSSQSSTHAVCDRCGRRSSEIATSPRRPIGRLQIGHLQKEEPAPAPAAPGKPGDGKGVRGKAASMAAAAQPQPQPQPEASKLYVKPSLKPIQKKK